MRKKKSNKSREHRGRSALYWYAMISYQTDEGEDTLLIDLMTDLMHAYGIVQVSEAFRTAETHAEEEGAAPF